MLSATSPAVSPYKNILFFRLFIIGLTALLPVFLGKTHFTYLTFAFLLAHYALALHYSRNQFKRIFLDPIPLIATLILILGTYLQIKFMFSVMPIFFGLHHALTEAYIDGPKKTGTESLFRFIFHLGVYSFVLRSQMLLPYGISPLFIFVLICAVFTILISRKKEYLIPRDSIAADGVFFVALVIAALVPAQLIDLTHVLFFHISIWYLYPLLKGVPALGDKSIFQDFRILSAIVTLVAITLVFVVFGQSDEAFKLWHTFTLAFGYFHINMSYALSKSNPDWIVKIFHRSNQPTNALL